MLLAPLVLDGGSHVDVAQPGVINVLVNEHFDRSEVCRVFNCQNGSKLGSPVEAFFAPAIDT